MAFVSDAELKDDDEDEEMSEDNNENKALMAVDRNDSITFLFQLVRGVEKRSYGLNVARLADLPSSVLDVAHNLSAKMEIEVESRKRMATVWKMMEIARNDSKGDVKHLLMRIEELK